MELSPIGIVADILWNEIQNHSKNVKLDAYIVMPNHIHGILVLNNPDLIKSEGNDTIETMHSLSLNHKQSIAQKRFQNQGANTLSSIIGAYKSAVSKHIHRLGFGFAWQYRFHDHIIRDDLSFKRIREYILNNPIKWKEDEFFL